MGKITVILLAVGAVLAVFYIASASSLSKVTVGANNPLNATANPIASLLTGTQSIFNAISGNPSPVTPTSTVQPAGITTGPTLSQAGLASGYLSTSQNVTAGLPSVANLAPPSTVLPLTAVNTTNLSAPPPGIDSPGISSDNSDDPTDYVGTGGVYYDS